MIFDRARRRLTVLYIALFGTALIVFSAVFFVALTVALNPKFDLTPDSAGEHAAVVAYRLTVEQLALGLVIADAVAIVVVGILARVVAARTLRPIRVAHERQRRFVADASHEIRSPVTAIRTLSEVQAASKADEATLRASLEQINAASQRLTRLVSDLLLLARSDDAEVASRGEVYDLSVVTAETYQLLAHAHPRLAVSATLSLAPDLTVQGDPDEIGRIVDNLIDNALRYGGPDVHIRLTTSARDREVMLEVADDGPGIPIAHQEQIFQPFNRGRSDARAPSGTGLGLAIAASLARRNSGRLLLDSRPGTGSSFTLVLPRFI